MLALAVSILLIAFGIPKIWRWFRTCLALSSLPTPAGNFLLGHLRHIGQYNHHQILTRWAADLGGIYRLRLGLIQVR